MAQDLIPGYDDTPSAHAALDGEGAERGGSPRGVSRRLAMRRHRRRGRSERKRQLTISRPQKPYTVPCSEPYLQRRLLPPSAPRSIKPPTTSITKPQKTFETISSPRASRTNTAPPMNNSVPHTSPDWRYSIRAATSPPPRLLPRVAISSLSTLKSTKAPATMRSMPKKGLNPISSPRALRTTRTPATSKTVPHTTPDSRCCIAATLSSRACPEG
jgi:hypothetical protein